MDIKKLANLKIWKLFILSLLILSCSKKKENIPTIIGDWEFNKSINLNKVKDKNTPPPSGINTHEEFEFFENGLCNYKNGWLEVIESIDKDREKRYVKYEKGLFKYKFENRVLTLNHLNNKLFNKYELKVTNDSLIFIDKKNKQLSFYNRVKENKNKIEFDKIILTSSGCFGPCRISSVVLNDNGIVYFNNQFYTEKNGTFISKISKNQFLDIERKFNKVNIDTLKNQYSFNATDGNTISVTFIKNGKIYKTITDYKSQSPTSFRQAYIELEYLSQSVNLKNINLPSELDFFMIFSFSEKNNKIELKDSEGVFLISELMKSKIVTNSFNPKYAISFLKFSSNNNNKLMHIYTDGRYYKFIFSNKKEIIRDLGYNFIDLNKLK